MLSLGVAAPRKLCGRRVKHTTAPMATGTFAPTALAADTAYQIVHIRPAEDIHGGALTEVAESIFFGLRRLGLRAYYRDAPAEPACQIIVGAHLLAEDLLAYRFHPLQFHRLRGHFDGSDGSLYECASEPSSLGSYRGECPTPARCRNQLGTVRTARLCAGAVAYRTGSRGHRRAVLRVCESSTAGNSRSTQVARLQRRAARWHLRGRT